MSAGKAGTEAIEVVAGILEEHGRFLVGLRPGGGRLPHLWEFPGGKVEAGESHEAALRRELQEELGIRISVGPAVGSSLHRYPHGTIRLSGYRVTHREGAVQAHAHRELRWVELEELRRLPLAPADLPLLEALAAARP